MSHGLNALVRREPKLFCAIVLGRHVAIGTLDHFWDPIPEQFGDLMTYGAFTRPRDENRHWLSVYQLTS